MSITDELRRVAAKTECANGRCEKLYRGDLDHIADRIDAEHQKAMSRAGQLLADAEKDRDYNYANWQDCKQKVLQHNITINELDAEIERLKDELAHCIELPKDADGEPIHVGDVMEERSGHTFEVASLMAFGGSENWLALSNPRNFSSFREPHDIRHHHAPTVEDVLREFAEKITDSQVPGVHPTYEEAIAEYTAKLRLAGDE